MIRHSGTFAGVHLRTIFLSECWTFWTHWAFSPADGAPLVTQLGVFLKQYFLFKDFPPQTSYVNIAKGKISKRQSSTPFLEKTLKHAFT